MKETRFCLRRSATLLLATGIVLFFFGCKSSNETISEGKVYYDFCKKELYKDADHTKPIMKRPLIVGEEKEIQLAITQFNPLRDSIMVEGSAYDRYDPNTGMFDNHPLLASLKKGTDAVTNTTSNYKSDTSAVKEYKNTDKNGPSVITPEEIDNIKTDLNNWIERYNNYMMNVGLIANIGDYLKTLDVVTPPIINEMVVANVITPINTNLTTEMTQNTVVLLKDSISLAFPNHFRHLEQMYYHQIEEIGKDVARKKGEVDAMNKGQEKNSMEKKLAEIQINLKDFEKNRKENSFPGFEKNLCLYSKLQTLAQREPMFITRSFPIAKDIQKIKIYNLKTTGPKEPYDEITVQMTHGFRIDVSGGIFFSGLSDKSYIADNSISDSGTIIYESSNEKISFGGMLFMHAHSQNANWFNYGGYLGLGAMCTSQTQYIASLGISAIIGRSQRCFINFGPAISQVDRLTKPYQIGVPYASVSNPVPTTKVTRFSWLLGISWRIGK